MKKHGVIIDITNNFLVFWPNHCIHIRATSLTILNQPRLPIETATVRIEKDITPQKMIKRGSKEEITDFLQMINKLSSKKRKQINKSKRKASLRETSSRKSIISSLNSSDKKNCQFLYRLQ